jgi:hypothetical protein
LFAIISQLRAWRLISEVWWFLPLTAFALVKRLAQIHRLRLFGRYKNAIQLIFVFRFKQVYLSWRFIQKLVCLFTRPDRQRYFDRCQPNLALYKIYLPVKCFCEYLWAREPHSDTSVLDMFHGLFLLELSKHFK